MRLIDSDRLLTDKMKSKYYHLQNGDIAIPIIDIEHAPTVDAIPKADYENRLKADLKAILVELQLKIEELRIEYILADYEEDINTGIEMAADAIQEKINELDGEHDPTPQI